MIGSSLSFWAVLWSRSCDAREEYHPPQQTKFECCGGRNLSLANFVGRARKIQNDDIGNIYRLEDPIQNFAPLFSGGEGGDYYHKENTPPFADGVSSKQ